MEKILYRMHPCRVIISGPSSSGKTEFLTNLILNIINEYEKIYIYIYIRQVFIKIYINDY